MKDQLEGVTLQMYKAGMRCSEAVQEFQEIFILTVLKDQRESQSKLPRTRLTPEYAAPCDPTSGD